MKRLMFALVSAVIAVGTQAASVQWSSNINGATTASPAIGASDYMVYLLDNSQWDTYVDSTTKKMDKAYLTAAAFDSATYTNPSGTTRLETGARTASGIDAASINYAIVLVNADASQYAVLKTGDSATYSGTQSPVTISAVNTTGARINGTASSGNLTWNAVDVPEPTSGILMLVGLGALALRRRKA